MASIHKMKRAESKKSHSWWWDSHVSPKNSKWLQENLEEMDRHVKRMLKLVEEDADSFSKKAELYFKKRPELIALVEDFYRMYRSLAERYDHAAGELKKRVPSDIQSQDSVITEEDHGPHRRTKSGPRAAGFDVFLGSQKSSASDFNSSSKGEEEESSSVDSESESDDSSVNNYNSRDELRFARERETIGPKNYSDSCNSVEFEAKIAALEESLRSARERIEKSDEEIVRLRDELCGYKSLAEEKDRFFSEAPEGNTNGGGEAECLDNSADKIRVFEDELRSARANAKKYEEEVAVLSVELASKDEVIKSAQKEATSWKTKYEREKREASKLQDRMNRFKANLSERDQEIRGLKEAMSNANKALSEENERLGAEASKIAKEKAYLEDSVKELDLSRQSSEEELRRARLGKAEMEEALWGQIEHLKADVLEKNDRFEELSREFDSLMAARDDLTAGIAALGAEVESKDENLREMVLKFEEGEKAAEELRLRVEELEVEVEKEREVIAEEKREAIRQLCFFVEYYRDRYDGLRKAVIAQKRGRRHSATAS